MNSASPKHQIEDLLANLPPEPSGRIEQHLASAPWTPRTIKRHQMQTVVYLTVILVIAFLGLTPQGRAFAQSIIKFFRTTDETSIPLSDEEFDWYYTPAPTQALLLVNVTPLPTLPNDCSTPSTTYECEIRKIEKELSIDLKEFATPPSGWAFTKVDSYTGMTPAYSSTIIMISYETSGGYLVLSQGNGVFPPDQQVLESAVEKVQIGEYYGEYVNGGFALMNGDRSFTWSSEGGHQRIRWKEGERWFELLALNGPGTSGYMDKQALIALVSAMTYQPDYSQQVNQFSMNAIPSIPLAIQICHCKILQATRLPEGMTLENVSYDSHWKSITLNYGYRALRIVQTPTESALIRNLDSYKNVEAIQIGDVTGQYGESPAQTTIWDSARTPAFPVTNSYVTLLWEKGGMIYQIYFDQSFSNGGQLTRDQLVEIAESLR